MMQLGGVRGLIKKLLKRASVVSQEEHGRLRGLCHTAHVQSRGLLAIVSLWRERHRVNPAPKRASLAKMRAGCINMTARADREKGGGEGEGERGDVNEAGNAQILWALGCFQV